MKKETIEYAKSKASHVAIDMVGVGKVQVHVNSVGKKH
jgi:hypothetical protein